MFVAPLDAKVPSTSSRTCTLQVSCLSAHECAMFQRSGVRDKPRVFLMPESNAFVNH